MALHRCFNASQFLSTLSLRRATKIGRSNQTIVSYFYPRSPCGERRRHFAGVPEDCNFYPRSPCGERLTSVVSSAGTMGFLSTLSLRRATPVKSVQCFPDWQISIHALLAESDLAESTAESDGRVISIHALLAESDCGCFARCRFWAYFYPRSPCGERLVGASQGADFGHISIHALLAESDSR